MAAMYTSRSPESASRGSRLKGSEPACYVIRVQGIVDGRWSDRLGGMTVTPASDNDSTATLLTGELADQAALLGVLNTLYNLGLPLLAVEYLGTPVGGRTRRHR
jgi:hypothetical protein